MDLSSEILIELENHPEDKNFAQVGFFPSCKVGNCYYPEGEIWLKYGFQHSKNPHNGFGIIHLVKGTHSNDQVYSGVTSLDDLVGVIKKALKKHSKIYMERQGNFIVISSQSIKIVLSFQDNEGIYSVVTCHNISNTYNAKKHGNEIGRIKKDLNC